MDIEKKLKSSRKILENIYEIVRILKKPESNELRCVFAAVILFSIPVLRNLILDPVKEEFSEAVIVTIYNTIGYFCYGTGIFLFVYVTYKVWRQILPITPDEEDITPDAVKGLTAFGPNDGKLFQELCREQEINELVRCVKNEQVNMVVVMGASGGGKTSLLRAGLSHVLNELDTAVHYWEATPHESEEALLHAVQQTWDDATTPVPQSLDDLIQQPVQKPHVIILDQFEQLGGGQNLTRKRVFRYLSKAIQEMRPPHNMTWIIAFRREYRPIWSDFILPEQKKKEGYYPEEMSIKLFSMEQAEIVTRHLLGVANISSVEKVAKDLINACLNEHSEVSPVDIGIGLLILSNLYYRKGRQTITEKIYHFAGGAEGLLEGYVQSQIEKLGISDQEQGRLLSVLLELRDPNNQHQRLSEGLSCEELAKRAGFADKRLDSLLKYLANRNVRILEKIEHENTYRLSHERLIPSIQRLARLVTPEEEQALIRLNSAYIAWIHNKTLLRGNDLSLVNKHFPRLPLGKESSKKTELLTQSLAARRKERISTLCIMVAIFIISGYAWTCYIDLDDRNNLKINQYPESLYEWQHQLNSVIMQSPIHLNDCTWIQSKQIKELDVKSQGNYQTLIGLRGVNCPSLSILRLDLSSSSISDLQGLETLSLPLNLLTLILPEKKLSSQENLKTLKYFNQLSQLTLGLSNSDVSKLQILENLKTLNQLTHLTLDLSNSDVSSLQGLESLKYPKQLKHLTLYINGIELSKIKGIEVLTNLHQLNLDLSNSEVNSLKGIETLTNLKQLELKLSGSEVTSLKEIDALKGLEKLTLFLNGSKVKSLPNIEISTLTQLELDISSSEVSSLRSLENLPLTDLALTFNDKISDLNLQSLTKIQELSQLTLALKGIDVNRLQGLKTLTNLDQYIQLTLILRGCDESSLQNLENLPNLTNLTLTLSNKTKYLDSLSKLKRLTHLNFNIDGSEVEDLKCLENLPLTNLTLTLNNKISNLDFLSKFNQLAHLSLNIDDSEVRDLKSLENLPLTDLTLTLNNKIRHNKKIKHLDSLSKIKKLNHLTLNLNDSDVEDLKSLKSIPDLTKLTILSEKNKLEKLEDIETLPQLTHLAIKGKKAQIDSLKSIPKNVRTLELEIILP